jgi:hypothetical protein
MPPVEAAQLPAGAEEKPAPVVTFSSFYPDIRSPEPASRDVIGSLPMRAGQRCNPVTTASSFGWYIYPPIDFALRWDGNTTEWALLKDNEPEVWKSLDGGYDAAIPEARKLVLDAVRGGQPEMDIFDKFGGTIPFINADPRASNTLEMMVGLVARTMPGWWLLTRSVPNWPHRADHQILEGVLESDWYPSFLPTVLRLTMPNQIVRFYRQMPIMVVQPIPANAFEMTKEPIEVRRGMAEFPPEMWRDFVEWRRNIQNPDTRRSYKRDKRREGRRARGAALGESDD